MLRLEFPLALEIGTKSLPDTIFQALTDLDKTTPPLTSAPMPQRMLAISLRLIDVRAEYIHKEDHS